MAKPCNPKPRKVSLLMNKKEYPSINCNFDLHYLPKSSSTPFSTKINQHKKDLRKESVDYNKICIAQYNDEEKKKRGELRREKIVQKLKKIYKVDVNDLSKRAANEVVIKLELLEKKKKEKEKRNLERMFTMLTRLIDEQKYKRRGVKKSFPSRVSTFKNTNLPKLVCESLEEEMINETEETDEDFEEDEQSKLTKEIDEKSQGLRKNLESNPSFASEEENKGESSVVPEFPEKSGKNLSEIFRKTKQYRSSQIDVENNLFETLPINRKPVPMEKDLECTPKTVVFQDYEKGRVYLQNVTITNIGQETIHCRYLGIGLRLKNKERFPIGVAVRDNVKLRPGLSCSTKIRLCSTDDSDEELECSVVYETRRKNKPLQHSWFFVPVLCTPPRAIVKVTPLRIVFPTLTWYLAIGPEGRKILKKIIKIENSGGKECFCRISKKSTKEHENPDLIESIRGEGGTMSSFSSIITGNVTEDNEAGERDNLYAEEFWGEFEESVKIAELFLDELIENVSAPFRFSEQYHIKIPAFSTKLVEVRFIPEYKGFHHEINYIQFVGCHNCTEEAIEMMGDIKKLPLKVEPQVIDFKTCIANSGVYVGTFKVHNESKGSYAVKIKIPRSIAKHAHVYPKATIIQPLSGSGFSVRIYPRVNLAKDAPQYFNEDSGVLEFPIFIYPAKVGSCKLDYIKMYVFALITDYGLELSPNEINFGTVTTRETIRTHIQLTNHSLAPLAFGFLNLPMGARVEPNMGFGMILPKESIELDLLYSPLPVFKENQKHHFFQIVVTNIAEYGGFREDLDLESETDMSYSQFIWGEDFDCLFPPPEDTTSESEGLIKNQEEESEADSICGEDFSEEGEQLSIKLQEQENKIREFLKSNRGQISEHSFFKQTNQHFVSSAIKFGENGKCFREEYLPNKLLAKPQKNIIKCQALVMEPYWRISDSILQLPATPCSSFSLCRIYLQSGVRSTNEKCPVRIGVKKIDSCKNKAEFESRFEFQYSFPEIKIEPQSGFLRPEDNLSITIIYRPEFSIEKLRHEFRMQKKKKFSDEKKTAKETSAEELSSITKFSRKERVIPSRGSNKLMNKSIMEHNRKDEISNLSLFEEDKCDLFASEKSLQESMDPFCKELRVQCVIETLKCGEDTQQTEVHDMILVCPVIKPNFIYLGNSQEINFNKVAVGATKKIFFEIQNISLERISPVISLLNPTGPFFCPASLTRTKVDPEHVWKQAITYAPTEIKGIEKEFFEIRCGPTNIPLTVKGEAIPSNISFSETKEDNLITHNIKENKFIKEEEKNVKKGESFKEFLEIHIENSKEVTFEPSSTHLLKESPPKQKKVVSVKNSKEVSDKPLSSILMKESPPRHKKEQ